MDLKKIYEDNEYELYEYIPTISKPLAINFERMRFVRRIRFLKAYLGVGHYKVYYLAVNGKLVGHCVIEPGGRRLTCSTEKDIVIGPYYIVPQYRGKGYSKVLVNLSIKYCSYQFQYVFDWVNKDNISSIRTSKACGFEEWAQLNVTHILRRLVLVKTGDNIVFRKKGRD